MATVELLLVGAALLGQAGAFGMMTFVGAVFGVAALPQVDPRERRKIVLMLLPVTMLPLIYVIGAGLLLIGLPGMASAALILLLGAVGLQIVFRLVGVGFGFTWWNVAAIAAALVGSGLLITP